MIVLAPGNASTTMYAELINGTTGPVTTGTPVIEWGYGCPGVTFTVAPGTMSGPLATITISAALAAGFSGSCNINLPIAAGALNSSLQATFWVPYSGNAAAMVFRDR